MLESLAESPEPLLVGLCIVVLGYLIEYREWTFLIAGYDASSEVPESVAASIVGTLAIRVGIATIAFGVLVAVSSIPRAITLAFVAAVFLGVARAVYRLQTYRPRPT